MSLRLTALAARTRPALVLLLGTLAVTLGLSASASADTTASLAAALAVTALLAAITVVTVTSPRTLTVGARSRAHREALSTTPEPAHPDTAGRTRARAPGEATTAA